MKPKPILLAALACLAFGCTQREIQDLQVHPWAQETNLEFVVIDSATYAQSSNAQFTYYHTNETLIPAGHTLVWTRIYRDGVLRNTQAYTRKNIVDVNVTSGQILHYELDFIESGGGITRRFGPFEVTVP